MHNLHNDTDAFRTLISRISSEQSILPEIIEKDYFVTLMLEEIAEKQKTHKVFFKGGTALYKALKSINRFSEDIDLTLNDEDFQTRTAKKKALKIVTSEYVSLPIDTGDADSVSGSGSRTTVYTYSTLFSIGAFGQDILNRIGRLKIETTSFTTSSPVEAYEIEAILYTHATEEDRKLLNEYYDVKPFQILCISIERIFIDKLYAIEDYFLGTNQNKLVEMSKHMYDIFQLYSLAKIKEFIESPKKVNEVIAVKEEEQKRRMGAKTGGKSIIQFEYFDKIADLVFRESFESMQRIYIFKDEYRVDFDKVIDCCFDIREKLKGII